MLIRIQLFLLLNSNDDFYNASEPFTVYLKLNRKVEGTLYSMNQFFSKFFIIYLSVEFVILADQLLGY